MPTWLLVGYLLLVPSFSRTKGCTGPERNAIQTVLNNVNWKTLADQLNLQTQVAAIQDVCNREYDVRPCYFREVVSRYIQTQSEESCDNTRRKIATALEQLGYVNAVSRLMGESPSHETLDHIGDVLNSSNVIPLELYESQTSCENPMEEAITQPASGPTQPPPIMENGINITYWMLSAMIIAALTCLIISRTTAVRQALTARSLASRPTLPELLSFKTSSGSTVNIVEEIGTHYSTLCPLLLNDSTGAITSAIISEHQRNANAINQEILTRWLQGQGRCPVTWPTLIDVLKDIELSELAEVIQDGLTSTGVSFAGVEPASSDVTEMTASSSPSPVPTSDYNATVSQDEGGSGSVRDRAREIAEQACQLQHNFMTVVLLHTKIYLVEKEEESRKFLNRFRITLTTLPLSNKHKHLHFLEEEKDRINMARNVGEILDILDPYWNYRDYAFLECIVKEFGTNELKNEMKKYIMELEEFEKKTSVKDYNSAALDKIKIPDHFETVTLKQHKDPARCSLHEVRQLTNEIKNRGNLNGWGAFLGVGCSSVIIVLAYPPAAYKLLSAALDEQFMKIHQLEWAKEETSHEKDAPLPVASRDHKYLEEEYLRDEYQEKRSLCPICLEVVSNPYMVPCCGSNYCFDCIMNLRSKQGQCPRCSQEFESIIPCPTCRKEFCENCMEKNAALEKELKDRYKVNCRHQNKGCKWTGLQQYSDEHEQEECRFVPNPKPTEERRDIVPVKRIFHNFSDREEDYKKMDPFYTHDGGYKMHLWIHPKGYKKGEYLAVFTCLVKGENDDNLKWPLRGSTTIQLLDQSGKGNHLERTIHYTSEHNDTYFGRVYGDRSEGMRPDKPFIALEALRGSDYLRNDCLKFRISECKVQTWRKEKIAFFVVIVLILIFLFFTNFTNYIYVS